MEPTQCPKMITDVTEAKQKTCLEIELAGAAVHQQEELEPVGLDEGKTRSYEISLSLICDLSSQI